jgi:hypothetical protein
MERTARDKCNYEVSFLFRREGQGGLYDGNGSTPTTTVTTRAARSSEVIGVLIRSDKPCRVGVTGFRGIAQRTITHHTATATGGGVGGATGAAVMGEVEREERGGGGRTEAAKAWTNQGWNVTVEEYVSPRVLYCSAYCTARRTVPHGVLPSN